MKDRDENELDEESPAGGLGSAADENVMRAESQSESDEPDTPTTEEENAGMNTVLDAEPLVGVQDDASKE